MAKRTKAAPNLWQQKIDEAKKEYFMQTLAPYITDDNVLDTKKLDQENHQLYREFMLGWRGIRNGCKVLGISPSEAAKKAIRQPLTAQIKQLALCFIEEKGIDESANLLGVTTNDITNIIDFIKNPPATKRGRKPKSISSEEIAIPDRLDDVINDLNQSEGSTAATEDFDNNPAPKGKKNKK